MQTLIFRRIRLNKRLIKVFYLCAGLLAVLVAPVDANQDHFDQLPDLGSKSNNYLSEYEAQQLGRAFIRQSRFRLPYISDPELVGYINKVGDRLLGVSEDANKDYNFYLIDNPIINAFAVPGGHIALHTAILTKSESESEMASVIAHEIAHVTQKHISRRIESQRYDSLIVLGALLAAAAAGGGEAAQAALGVSQAAVIDKQLTYSRSFESEADALGIRLLSKAGYNPGAMPMFFKRLLDENRINESNAPEFLRSHPLTLSRITESAERVRAYPPANLQNEDEFLLMRAKAYASYSEDKQLTRDVFDERIKSGQDSLANRYGFAITLTRNGEFEKARQQFDDLLKDFPGNISVRLMQADNELEAKQIDTGLELLKSLYEEQVSKGHHLIDIYYANALVLTNSHETALPILRAAIKNDPTEPYLHLLLSRTLAAKGDTYGSFRERGEYHYLRGNYEFAIKQYKRAFPQAKTDYERARLGARIEDVEKELEALKKL